MQHIKRFLYIFAFIFFLIFAPPVFADGEFKTDVIVSYKIESSGISEVTNTITLENLFSDLYATSYTLVLDNIKAINIKATQGQNILPIEIKEDGTKKKISISFPDAIVGKGNKRVFNVTYNDSSIAAKTGEVWEITIPRLTSDSAFNSYNLSLLVPLSFGDEAYLSPNPIKKEVRDGYRSYYFEKESASKTGIVAGFGQFQVFSFNLTYHLENPLIKEASTEIALPPDTSFQKIYYDSIEPAPSNIKVDEDGNWIATYVLPSRKRLDITAKGSVQIFAGVRPFNLPSNQNLTNNLLSTDYWQASNSAIIELAKKYKTPKDIYSFVTNYLSYNFDKVKPNVERLGALGALNDPSNAICMEYTDLFIAIARAAGIPAREINGYAYTENVKLQPISLVSDILHAWPEYWDFQKKAWIPVDPTWGSTTGGVDFFNKLDLRHFTFVIHGKDSSKPYPPGSYKLGPNPQKDVFVNFSQLPIDRNPHIKILSETVKPLPFSAQKISVSVLNTQGATAYNLPISVLFDDEEIFTEDIMMLPSFGRYNFIQKVPFSFLGTKTPHLITITAGNEQINIKGAKVEVIIYNLASIFLLSLIVILGVLIKLGKLKCNIQKYKNWLKSIFRKKT